tara:strand:+ start:91 stop:435 length:345 start_codon:yes stop_codon:yes gene_type:complete
MQFEKPKNATQIGEGGYKRVFHSESERPERVWAEFKHEYTAEQAKSIYYLNNIAHLMFPNQTVHIHQSGIDIDNLNSSCKERYYINIPKEIMKELKWRERQKLVVKKSGKKLIT